MNASRQNKAQERYKKLSNELVSVKSKIENRIARNADQSEIDALNVEAARLTDLITEIIMSDSF